jgi:hypothetical protein
MKFEQPVSREDILKAKSVFRQNRASSPLDEKMVALVRMQAMNYEMASTTGRAAPKPWHYDDKEKMKKIASQR